MLREEASAVAVSELSLGVSSVTRCVKRHLVCHLAARRVTRRVTRHSRGHSVCHSAQPWSLGVSLGIAVVCHSSRAAVTCVCHLADSALRVFRACALAGTRLSAGTCHRSAALLLCCLPGPALPCQYKHPEIAGTGKHTTRWDAGRHHEQQQHLLR